MGIELTWTESLRDWNQTSKPTMVSIVSSISIGGNFIVLESLDVNFVQKCKKSLICVSYTTAILFS